MEAEALDDEFDTQNLAGIVDRNSKKHSSSMAVSGEDNKDLIKESGN